MASIYQDPKIMCNIGSFSQNHKYSKYRIFKHFILFLQTNKTTNEQQKKTNSYRKGYKIIGWLRGTLEIYFNLSPPTQQYSDQHTYMKAGVTIFRPWSPLSHNFFLAKKR